MKQIKSIREEKNNLKWDTTKQVNQPTLLVNNIITLKRVGKKRINLSNTGNNI